MYTRFKNRCAELYDSHAKFSGYSELSFKHWMQMQTCRANCLSDKWKCLPKHELCRYLEANCCVKQHFCVNICDTYIHTHTRLLKCKLMSNFVHPAWIRMQLCVSIRTHISIFFGARELPFGAREVHTQVLWLPISSANPCNSRQQFPVGKSNTQKSSFYSNNNNIINGNVAPIDWRIKGSTTRWNNQFVN